MLKNAAFLVMVVSIIGCMTDTQTKKSISMSDINVNQYRHFGNEITATKILNKEMVSESYHKLQVGDTVHIAFRSVVNNVCKAKGCWMKLAMDTDKETMVKFKDYGFFVPKDIENDTVIVQGIGFIKETSIDELRHYARDAGKTEEEIETINAPKVTYSFIADGVLVKK